jgi:hypothetical protein
MRIISSTHIFIWVQYLLEHLLFLWEFGKKNQYLKLLRILEFMGCIAWFNFHNSIIYDQRWKGLSNPIFILTFSSLVRAKLHYAPARQIFLVPLGQARPIPTSTIWRTLLLDNYKFPAIGNLWFGKFKITNLLESVGTWTWGNLTTWSYLFFTS